MVLRWTAAAISKREGLRRLRAQDSRRSSPHCALAINNSASSCQWRTSRRMSIGPPPNFNTERGNPRVVTRCDSVAGVECPPSASGLNPKSILDLRFGRRKERS